MTAVDHETCMARAIELARVTAIDDRAGGPFGCVIVRDGEIIAEGANRVLAEGDPTWHAEIAAIRAASATLGTHDLRGCMAYASGEPCAMCAAALHWARIDRVYYASSVEDAADHGGFDDATLTGGPSVPTEQCCREQMLEVWRAFASLDDRPSY